MKSITVFCGASSGTGSTYTTEAHLLGQTLARLHITLIYGGAKIGVMGAVADGALATGGRVVGVIPGFLRTKEVAHEGLTELVLVKTMHERKMIMHERCEGIIALPGGFGTLEELFEVLTWAQLGLHQKPIGLLNINGYYDSLLALIQTMVDQGFLKKLNQDMLLVSSDIQDLLTKMQNYKAPQVEKWVTDETT